MIKNLYFESKHLPDLTRCLNCKYSNQSKTELCFTLKSLVPEVYPEMITDLMPELDELIFGYHNEQCREYLWSLHYDTSESVRFNIAIYSSLIPADSIAELRLIVREIMKIQDLLFKFELNPPTPPSGELIDCGFAVCNEVEYI